MKFLIDGEIYDTEDSLFIGTIIENDYDPYDHWSEDLYKASNCNFFIVGSGGCSSKYGQRIKGSNKLIEGEKAILLSTEEASNWLESYLENIRRRYVIFER